MRQFRWKLWLGTCLVLLVVWSAGRGGEGQSSDVPDKERPTQKAKASDSLDLSKRVERLEKQNETLLRLLKQRSTDAKKDSQPPDSREGGPGSEAPSGGKTKPDAGTGGGGSGSASSDEREGPGSEAPPAGQTQPGTGTTGTDRWMDIGKDLGLYGQWLNYQPWFETKDRAFRIHVGGRTQIDAVWASAPERVQFGKGGIGAFEDGVNFRRARLEMEGWMYEYFDFKCEYDFINSANVDPLTPATNSNVINTPVPTELWAGINYIPYVGFVRVGNQKNPLGLDHIISSRFLDFMERAAYFDIFENRNNGLQPGIQILNWTANERFTWQYGLFKNNQFPYGWNFGNGANEVNGRVTWLPWYLYEGRYMIHLGFGAQYDAPGDGGALLRYRWLLRNGPTTLQNAVALANINGHHQTMAIPEFFMNLGPLSIQAEWLVQYLDNISNFTTQSQGAVKVPGGEKSYFAQSAYIQALYFLTGEYRPYFRTGLHSSGAAPSRVVPYRNFFWLPGHKCPNPFSSGAWQVGVRYNWTNLSNNGIFGGEVSEVTLGLNWFLNPNAKIQWNYDVGYRGNLGPLATSNGTFQGFGTRLAFDF